MPHRRNLKIVLPMRTFRTPVTPSFTDVAVILPLLFFDLFARLFNGLYVMYFMVAAHTLQPDWFFYAISIRGPFLHHCLNLYLTYSGIEKHGSLKNWKIYNLCSSFSVHSVIFGSGRGWRISVGPTV
jgi:hypothetical protein